MRKLLIPLLALSSLLVGCTSTEKDSSNQLSIEDCPKVNEAPLVQCIKQYKILGVSPDLALSECKKNKLSECIKSLEGKNFVARSIKKETDGFLIDLGNISTRWMLKSQWEDKGCIANKKGISRTQFAHLAFNNKKYFRQGFCQSEAIEINQSITVEQAKLSCEINMNKN